MKNNKTILSRIKKGAKLGWIISTTSEKIIKYESGPLVYILKILATISTGYLMRYNVFGYNSYLICLAILITVCFFISHLYVSIDRWILIYKTLKNNKLDIKDPQLDQLVIRSARFTICAKGLSVQIRPLWILLGIILGFNLTEKVHPVEEKIIDLIKSPWSKIENNNKDIKELTKLINAVSEWGSMDDCMKKDAFEIIKELDKRKADMLKSNYKLTGKIVDILKSNCFKKK